MDTRAISLLLNSNNDWFSVANHGRLLNEKKKKKMGNSGASSSTGYDS